MPIYMKHMKKEHQFSKHIKKFQRRYLTMKIAYDNNFEPNTFNPNEYFIVFTEDLIGTDGKECVVGCANMQYTEGTDTIEYSIENIESDGHGSKIINFLMNAPCDVIISGNSAKDALPFWLKMGALIETDNMPGNYPFILHKSEFMKTKYHTNTLE